MLPTLRIVAPSVAAAAARVAPKCRLHTCSTVCSSFSSNSNGYRQAPNARIRRIGERASRSFIGKFSIVYSSRTSIGGGGLMDVTPTNKPSVVKTPTISITDENNRSLAPSSASYDTITFSPSIIGQVSVNESTARHTINRSLAASTQRRLRERRCSRLCCGRSRRNDRLAIVYQWRAASFDQRPLATVSSVVVARFTDIDHNDKIHFYSRQRRGGARAYFALRSPLPVDVRSSLVACRR